MNYEHIWDVIYRLSGRVRVSKSLINRNEEILLHISDTPYSIFSALDSLIMTLKPEYIVHTGDLVDNIKLELYPKSLPRYKLYLKNLMKIMQKPFVKGIYISLGNHDDIEAISEYKKIDNRITVGIEPNCIKLGDKTIHYAHYLEALDDKPNSYGLYGHDLSVKDEVSENSIYLNGIKTINIVMLKSGTIYKLQYPIGTDDARLKKGRIGF